MQSINVNLKRCEQNCRVQWTPAGRQKPPHLDGCPGAPVLIPCPIPRSVTFTVRLGECECAAGAKRGGPSVEHLPLCPARPIRVACSVSGNTWAESEVFDVENAARPDGLFIGIGPEPEDALAACRALWGIVVALVTNALPSETRGGLVTQRDAVFAALADMARDEAHHAERMASLPRRIRPVLANPDYRPSHEALSRYIEDLIEQVGVL